jgi:hypothetical protein
MLLSSIYGGLPFLHPFLHQDEQGKRSGLRCFVLPGLPAVQYECSAVACALRSFPVSGFA